MFGSNIFTKLKLATKKIRCQKFGKKKKKREKKMLKTFGRQNKANLLDVPIVITN